MYNKKFKVSNNGKNIKKKWYFFGWLISYNNKVLKFRDILFIQMKKKLIVPVKAVT